MSSESATKPDSNPSSRPSDEEIVKTVARYEYIKRHSPHLLEPGVTFTPEQKDMIDSLTDKARFEKMVLTWAKSRGVKSPGESP